MSVEAPVFTLRYGGIELVIAEHTLSSNSAPFTIIAPADDFNKVEDTVLLAAFQSQFTRLEELVPKSIPMLRAYATLIMFHRISKNPGMALTHEQAKAGLMGANAEDTLLFIVAKLLRHDDAELRRYLQHPHILVSSLLKIKHAFILGDGNIVRLFHEARMASEGNESSRLTMKEFAAVYQRIDFAGSPASEEVEAEGKEEKVQAQEDEGEEKADAADAEDNGVVRTRTRSADKAHSSSSSSTSSTTKAPIYHSSSSSSSKKKNKRGNSKDEAECVNCHLNNRPSELMHCDRVDCETVCHFDCTVPPLSHVPEGSWFCALCKPRVRRALEEEQSLAMRAVDEEEQNAASSVVDDEKKEDSDQVEEISAARWRLEQERWRRDRENYEKALAAKDAEVEQLRAEVERFKRQRVEPMEEERKEPPPAQNPAQEERKESSPKKGENPASNKQKRRGRAR